MKLVLQVCFLMAVFFVFIGACVSCGSEQANNLVAPEEPINNPKEVSAEFACVFDSDCDVMSVDCCDCNHGGKNQAVAKSYQEKILSSRKKKCANIMCITMISSDPSCTKKQAICVQNQCELK